jgi:hypothetical protein
MRVPNAPLVVNGAREGPLKLMPTVIRLEPFDHLSRA